MSFFRSISLTLYYVLIHLFGGRVDYTAHLISNYLPALAGQLPCTALSDDLPEGAAIYGHKAPSGHMLH